jgi:hypothetical protein
MSITCVVACCRFTPVLFPLASAVLKDTLGWWRCGVLELGCCSPQQKGHKSRSFEDLFARQTFSCSQVFGSVWAIMMSG